MRKSGDVIFRKYAVENAFVGCFEKANIGVNESSIFYAFDARNAISTLLDAGHTVDAIIGWTEPDSGFDIMQFMELYMFIVYNPNTEYWGNRDEFTVFFRERREVAERSARDTAKYVDISLISGFVSGEEHNAPDWDALSFVTSFYRHVDVMRLIISGWSTQALVNAAESGIDMGLLSEVTTESHSASVSE